MKFSKIHPVITKCPLLLLVLTLSSEILARKDGDWCFHTNHAWLDAERGRGGTGGSKRGDVEGLACYFASKLPSGKVRLTGHRTTGSDGDERQTE